MGWAARCALAVMRQGPRSCQVLGRDNVVVLRLKLPPVCLGGRQNRHKLCAFATIWHMAINQGDSAGQSGP